MEKKANEKMQSDKRTVIVITAVVLVAAIIAVIAIVSENGKKQKINTPFGVDFGISESEMISLMEKNGFTYDAMQEIDESTAAYQFTGAAPLYGGTTTQVIIAAASGTINYQVFYPKDQQEAVQKAVTEEYGEPKDLGEGLIWEGEKCIMILYSSAQNPNYCMLHIALTK